MHASAPPARLLVLTKSGGGPGYQVQHSLKPQTVQAGIDRMAPQSECRHLIVLGTVLVTIQGGALLYTKDRSWTWELAWTISGAEMISPPPENITRIEMGCTDT